MASTDFAIAFLAGLIPILFWLWFWLHEDRQRPEPIILIIITFLAGMMVVPIALPLQKMAIDGYTAPCARFSDHWCIYCFCVLSQYSGKSDVWHLWVVHCYFIACFV